MKKFYYELFDEFETLKTKDERKAWLSRHDTITLRRILRAAFNPRIKFFITHVPAKFKGNRSLGTTMADYSLDQVMGKIHLFELGHPEYAHLTYKKREELLLQFLDGMPEREALLLIDVLFKQLSVKFLTPALVREVWPGLIPLSLDGIPKT